MESDCRVFVDFCEEFEGRCVGWKVENCICGHNVCFRMKMTRQLRILNEANGDPSVAQIILESTEFFHTRPCIEAHETDDKF